MDYQAIVNLISGVGFPIVMCLIMFKYMEDENKAHQEESTNMREAINDLKVAITQLTERLSKQ